MEKANKRQVLQPIDQNTVFPESKIGQSESGNTTITKDRNTKYDKDMMMSKKNYDEVVNLFCRLSPDLRSHRVTRSVSKVLNYWNNFIIVEDYRCMPLLGDEDEVPNWEAHVVKYSIVFI